MESEAGGRSRKINTGQPAQPRASYGFFEEGIETPYNSHGDSAEAGGPKAQQTNETSTRQASKESDERPRLHPAPSGATDITVVSRDRDPKGRTGRPSTRRSISLGSGWSAKLSGWSSTKESISAWSSTKESTFSRNVTRFGCNFRKGKRRGKVRFEDGDAIVHAALGVNKSACDLKVFHHYLLLPIRLLEIAELYWDRTGCRQVTIVTSIFELWSMGIWIAFMVEPNMANILGQINIIDMVANVVYLMDKSLMIVGQRRMLLQQQEQKALKRLRFSCFRYDPTQLKSLIQFALACGTLPIQLVLRDMLQGGIFPAWKVTLVLIFRFGRVAWAFKDCLRLVKKMELQIYVNLRIKGNENANRVIAKQFLIVLFFGHWFGCWTYALKSWGRFFLEGSRNGNEDARDYFERFSDEGTVPYTVGDGFALSYLLAVYKGFNMNLEDLLPERPDVLVLEMIGSVLLVLMKSYCVGSFFKHHQSREVERSKFKEVLNLATSYTELYQLPPSLKKSVLKYFHFMSAKRHETRTIEVLEKLPIDVQKQIREHELLPLVKGRNPQVFADITRELLMKIIMLLNRVFLQPGEVIFLEGEAPRELFFLDMGTISLSRKVVQTDGKAIEALIRHLRADRADDPTIFGEAALIFGRLHFYSARVRAGLEVTLLQADREAFDLTVAEYPEELELLVRNVAETYMMDSSGQDLDGKEKTAEHNETDTHVAMQEEVRATLKSRQEMLHSAFQFAAGAGNVTKVNELLSRRAEVNITDYDKRSAMHVAASEGMADVLEALLQARGHPNLKDRWESTPMQDALKNSYYGAAKQLQQFGGVLDLSDPAGALCKHASEGDTVAMQQLLDFKVDANTGDYDARTALHLSAAEGHLTVVTFLTSRSANVNVKDRWNSTPMMDAIRAGFTAVARHLRTHGGRVDQQFAASMLYDAASTGNLLQLEMLYECGVDLNEGDYDHRTALHLAAREGQTLALNYLAKGARTNVSPQDRWLATPLQDALVSGEDLSVQFLINAGASLGLSATPEQRQKVAEMKTEWFGDDGARHVGLITALRQKASRHLKLVDQGRARSDILDAQQAVAFNRQLVMRQIEGLRALCKDVAMFSSLLHGLGSEFEKLNLLHRAIEDGNCLVQDSRYWVKRNADKKRQADKKKGKKDVHPFVFDSMYLNCVRIGSEVVNMVDMCSSKLLSYVDEMEVALTQPLPEDEHEIEADDRFSQMSIQRLARQRRTASLSRQQSPATNANSTPSLSILLATEVIAQVGNYDSVGEKPLGTVVESQTTSRGSYVGGHVQFAAWNEKALNASTQVRHLAARLESIAGQLLQGHHFRQSFLDLLFAGSEVSLERESTVDDCIRRHTPGSESSFRELWTCLQRNDRARLINPNCPSRPVARTHPVLGSTPFSSLVISHPMCQSKGRTLPAPSGHIDENRDDDEEQFSRYRKAVAENLVLLTLTALLMEIWEKLDSDSARGGDMVDDGVENGDQGDHKPRSSLYVRGRVVNREALEQLGRAIREAARECHGLSVKQQERLNQAARRKQRELAKEIKETGKANEGGEKKVMPMVDVQHNDIQEKSKEELPQSELKECRDKSLKIDTAKILAFEQNLTTETLALLVDLSDVPQDETEGALRIFGSISRERFVFNLLRWCLDHDEHQKEILACKTYQDLKPTARAHLDRCSNASGSTIECYTLEDEIYHELDELQEKMSQASSDDEAEEQVHEHNQWGNTVRLASLGSDDSLDFEVDNNTHICSLRRFLWRSLRYIQHTSAHIRGRFGQEGAMRRKQKRITKRFHELDEDGEGVGVSEVAHLLGVAYHYTLAQEQLQHMAYRAFELLDQDETGGLVTLPDLLKVLPRLDEELHEQQKKGRAMHSSADGSRIHKWLSLMTLPPDTQWLSAWDFVKDVVCVYIMIEVPITFCYVTTDRLVGIWRLAIMSLDYATDAFMIMNTILNFFRGFVHSGGGIVTSFNEIRVHYVLNFFFVDVVACCPLDHFVPTSIVGAHSLVSRPRATARLLRLLHLRNVMLKDKTREGRKWQVSDGFFGSALSIVSKIWFLVHFLGCFWWLLGTRWTGFDDTWTNGAISEADTISWVYTYEHRDGEPPFGGESGLTPFWWQYLISVYWVLGRITTNNSPGNLFPGGWHELMFTCVLFVLQVAVSGYCDGILVDKVIGADESIIEAASMRTIVDEYLQKVEFPHSLMVEVRASADASALFLQRRRMEEVCQMLPHSLRQRIAQRIFLPYFRSSAVFRHVPQTFLLELAVCCRILVVGKETQLAQIGTPAERLLMLNHGRVAILDENSSLICEVCIAGEAIEEVPFIFELKHGASVIATEESKLLSLGRSDFARICKMHPEDYMTLRREAINVVDCSDNNSEAEVKPDKVNDAKSAVGKAKSDAGSMHSRSSSASSNALSSVMGRLYRRDLAQVLEKAHQEETATRLVQLGRFIQYAADGDVKMINETMSKGGISVDSGDYDKRTAIHLASCNGHLHVVRELVERFNASIWVKDRFGNAPIDDAVREQQPEVAMYLMQCGAQYQVDADVSAQLCEAAFKNDTKFLQLLLSEVCVDPNVADYDSRTALHLAASEGHIAAIEVLLNIPGINVSPRDRLGNTPLDDALRHRHAEARRILLEKGAQMGDQDVGAMLCTFGARNDLDRLRDLADSNVPIDAGDNNSRTCLHLAASEGSLETATYLLKTAHANPNSLDRFLSTPLDEALRHNQSTVALLLKEHGGMPGTDERMKDNVAKFETHQENQRLKKTQEQLDREMKTTEVSTLSVGLRRLVDHPTLEDDTHAFIAYATNFRVLFLHILREAAEANDAKSENPQLVTKELREHMLEKTIAGLESVGSRLASSFDAEVLPWSTKLPKNESKVLRLLAPGFCEKVLDIREHLKSSTEIITAARKLACDSGSISGDYQCTPIGALASHMHGGLNRNLHQLQLDAFAMLWLSKPASGASENGEDAENVQAPAPIENRSITTSLALQNLCTTPVVLRETEEQPKSASMFGYDQNNYWDPSHTSSRATSKEKNSADGSASSHFAGGGLLRRVSRVSPQ